MVVKRHAATGGKREHSHATLEQKQVKPESASSAKISAKVPSRSSSVMGNDEVTRINYIKSDVE
jgi:hypothetical protein